ncbi:hypothetical protein [Peribacillus acanthi]|uniref:hypothetical protein n=1 Tax=Peribacillus acanthi TaxID=2171554 RepID=UPI000D3EC627|nr:hypothetical protein [Peribacillus acanthi]
MNIQIDLNHFNLKEFLKHSIAKGKLLMTPNVFSTKTAHRYEEKDLKAKDEHDLFRDVIEEGKYLYVNFSSSAMDNALTCIDGETYHYIKEDEVEEYFEDEEIPEGFQPAVRLEIYEDSSVGYLLKYENSQLHIQTALIDVSDSSIQFQDDVEMLNASMKQYLTRFMK